MPTLRSLWAELRVQRLGALRKLLPAKPAPLPEIEMATGPVLPAFPVRVIAAVLPFLLVLLSTVRVTSGFALTVFLLVLALVLAAFALLLPSGTPALLAIGLAALIGLARPPSVPWALGFAAIGHLAFRTGMLANQLPWTAKISRDLILRWALRDLLILTATAFAGVVAMGGQWLTGCRFTGPFVAEANQVVEVTECHPAGYGLTVIGALALTTIALGLGNRFLRRTL